SNDDGQELTQLSFSKDGRYIVYVRGGDHGSRPGEVPPNPAESPVQPKIQIWAAPVTGVAPRLLADGDGPVITPDGTRVTFVRERRIWTVPIDGSKAAQPLFSTRGSSDSPAWSPDGRTIAFVSDRTDHSFIGLYKTDQPIRFIAASTSRDRAPQWSADGRKIAFLR